MRHRRRKTEKQGKKVMPPGTAKSRIEEPDVAPSPASRDVSVEAVVPQPQDVGQVNMVPVASRRTGEQLEAFKRLYKEFEARNYRFFKSSAAKRKALAERRIQSGFYSGR